MHRVMWPAAALIAAGETGVELSFASSLGAFQWGRRPDGSRRPVGLAHRPDYDVAVLQRPLTRDLADAIPMLQAAGVAVVVDLDDDIARVPANHPVFMIAHPSWNDEENWHHLERACRQADLVTVSTPALAPRYGGHGRVTVLRNCVPERYLGVGPAPVPRPSVTRPIVGWTGAPIAHYGDLEVAGGAVGRVIASHPSSALFRAVGSDLSARQLGVAAESTEVEPWAPLLDGYPEMVASLDVGLAPLAMSAFNEAKSALRGLEYAALGVPFIASPTSEYRWMASQGAGLLAAKPKEWARTLGRMLSSAELRADVAARGREAAALMTYEANAWRWAEAWTSAVARRSPAACTTTR